MTFEELRDLLALDVDALDECLMEQAKLYEVVAESSVTAETARDKAELELEELVSQVDKEIRETAVVSGGKLTESAIKAEIALDRNVKASNRTVLDLQHEAKRWRALERSFDQRADMLKKLVDLHLRTTYGYALENSVGQARGNLVAANAEATKKKVQVVRRKRLEGAE